MNDPFEDLIRRTLIDLTEEVPSVPDQTKPAFKLAQRRRTTVTIIGAACLTAAVLIGGPIALAATDRNQTPGAPGHKQSPPAPTAPGHDNPAPSPSTPGHDGPTPSPGQPGHDYPTSSPTTPGHDGPTPFPSQPGHDYPAPSPTTPGHDGPTPSPRP